MKTGLKAVVVMLAIVLCACLKGQVTAEELKSFPTDSIDGIISRTR